DVNSDATTQASFGTVPDPAPPAPTPAPVPDGPAAREHAAEASATAAPTPLPTLPPATVLPDDVTGLTADEVRCATANLG
ncbi:MAG TPA: hypothetical protein VFN04_06305, partial [Protaetiibacter sp.]|nr:hypothetical protein [Protaetiibacter sp.]